MAPPHEASRKKIAQLRYAFWHFIGRALRTFRLAVACRRLSVTGPTTACCGMLHARGVKSSIAAWARMGSKDAGDLGEQRLGYSCFGTMPLRRGPLFCQRPRRARSCNRPLDVTLAIKVLESRASLEPKTQLLASHLPLVVFCTCQHSLNTASRFFPLASIQSCGPEGGPAEVLTAPSAAALQPAARHGRKRLTREWTLTF